MIKRFLYGLAFLAISYTSALAACGTGSPPAGTVCAAPAGAAGNATYRPLADGHIPSGINAAKIGGGSVSTTEYDRLDGITAYGQSIVSTANEAALKTLTNLEIDIDVQAFDPDLTTWAGLSPSANAQSLVTAANYAAMRALLDLEPGTDFYSIAGANAAFQPLDADLTVWAGVTSSANGRSLVSAADYAAMRALLDLEPGTDFYSIAGANAAFQPLDGDLTAIAALTTTAAGRSVLAFTDPNADNLLMWDDSAGAFVIADLTNVATEAAPAAGDYIMVTRAEGDVRKVNWSSLPGAGGGISNVVEDTTPQLGGALDTNGNPIELGTANTDTSLTRSAAGVMAVEGIDVPTISSTSTLTNKSINWANNTITATSAQFNTANSDGDFAFVGAANNFTADQTLTSTDAGAGAGPNIIFDRNSASPAAEDSIGSFDFRGRSSTGVTRVYANVQGRIRAATNGAEEGRLHFRTIQAGSENTRFLVGSGLYSQNVTGADKGDDTLNVTTIYQNNVSLATIVANKPESFCFAMSDETTLLTTGTAKIKFRMPYAFTVTAVRASLSTAQTAGSIFTVDLNEGGSTILSTKLTIDNSESTSTTAATPPVISDSSLADDAEISGDIDQVGTPLAKGLKVCIIGHQ